MLHPFRPLSTQYPPGDLPPGEVLDELTHQIVHYAPRLQRLTPAEQDVDRDDCDDAWAHSWEATRRKLFEMALADSKFGQQQQERRKPRAERLSRPGLRRVDSMDFLDEGDSDQLQDLGRAAR